VAYKWDTVSIWSTTRCLTIQSYARHLSILTNRTTALGVYSIFMPEDLEGSSLPIVASVSGLSILDYPIRFSLTFIYNKHLSWYRIGDVMVSVPPLECDISWVRAPIQYGSHQQKPVFLSLFVGVTVIASNIPFGSWCIVSTHQSTTNLLNLLA
jgi:hypothetical protein